MLRILIEDSEGKSKIAPINPDSDITIGRKEGNSIRLKERNVSREHARIYSTSDGLFIEPVKARYGLKVNSAKIDGPTPLALGDEIRIGDYRLYVQDENQPQPQQADPDAIVDIPPELRPRLVVTSSNFAGTEYPITKTRVTIGRGDQCEVHISHPSVSSQHAEIRRTPRGDFEIRDLNSSNGTKVNGEMISGPVYLTSGCMIALGHVIMRFCAPGDFWTLNFGHYEDKSRVSFPMMVFMAIIMLCVGALTAIVVVTQLNSNQDKGATVNQNVDSKANDSSSEEFMTKIVLCGALIDSGSYEEAQKACDEAAALSPDSPLLKPTLEKLRTNQDSQSAYDDVVASLSDKRCDDADDSFNRIVPPSNAFNRATQENLSDQIKRCKIERYYDKAMVAIDNNDIDTANMLLRNIRSLDQYADEASRVQARLAERRPSRVSRRSHDSGSAKVAEAPAPAPVKKEDVNDICQQAVKAKLKDKCKGYRLYKKAMEIGGASDTCKRAAESTIRDYKKQCE